MVKAYLVLKEAVDEAALLATTGRSLEELQALALLARDALDAGDGDLLEERVRDGGVHAPALARLGLVGDRRPR